MRDFAGANPSGKPHAGMRFLRDLAMDRGKFERGKKWAGEGMGGGRDAAATFISQIRRHP
jgi:hypothetical protein